MFSCYNTPDSDEWTSISWSSRSEPLTAPLFDPDELKQENSSDFQDSDPPGLDLPTSDLDLQQTMRLTHTDNLHIETKLERILMTAYMHLQPFMYVA